MALRRIARTGLTAAALFVSGPALADWAVDNERSQVSFVSVKNGDLGEVHFFRALSGRLAEDGRLEISVDLSSVETWVDIRNDRMRDFLFEVADFPAATITARIDMEKHAALGIGAIERGTYEATVALHGHEAPVTLDLVTTRLGKDRVLVTTLEPVVLDAEAFALGPGIAELARLADLRSISAAVPVSAVLTFVRGSETEN